jgi:hypothetical protein
VVRLSQIEGDLRRRSKKIRQPGIETVIASQRVGTKKVFLAGVLGFSITSLWRGLAQSGTELIVARLAQGWSRRPRRRCWHWYW